MSKRHTQFICESCGRAQSKWMGKCPDCGEWNSLVEQVVSESAEDLHRPIVPSTDQPIVAALSDVKPDATVRYPSGISEFDRMLGGGIVPGSAILVGGDPGIGKSTLLLQAGHRLAAAGRKTLYISSEESLGQIRLRGERLGLLKDKSTGAEHLLISAAANLDIITNLIEKERPQVVVIDSIQMVYRPDMTAAPGSATQLRDAAARLIWLAKQMSFSLLLVGHVTKEGAIAGPKILEHLVDCVAYFEGDRFHAHRIIRTIKNRFGSTDEIGVFEITDSGLIPIADPSKLFLQGDRKARPGSVILAACEGTRTLLVEVQALCAQSVFGSAKRRATGVDSGRVAMILAVIEKHGDCVVGDQDVFVNVVGGVRVYEPAADLAIALAVMSAMTQRSLPVDTVVCGELGLGAELRPVNHQRQRVAEAARVGFKRFLMPPSERRASRENGIELLNCESLADARRHLC
ncbi:MAG TPA: DNA repair protein RadA [Phycisphaerae bacterium]|nr:DNA repair protein RadA [Phycisphaerae bacterium]